MLIENYLVRKEVTYSALSDDEKKAISNFALIWSLFEARLLNTNAKAVQLQSSAKKWCDVYKIDLTTVDGFLNHFKERYVEDNELNYRFEHLNLRKNDNPKLIKEVLLGKNESLENKLATCLIITLRYRNNLFHGLKWAYYFVDQQDNLEISCHLLVWCLESFTET